MKKQIQLNIIRRVPVFTLAELSDNRLEDLQKRKRVLQSDESDGGLLPYYFAQSKTKTVVFTSPYKTLIEKLEVIGESKKIFKNIPITFENDGMPLLEAVHKLEDMDKLPPPQLLLRFAE